MLRPVLIPLVRLCPLAIAPDSTVLWTATIVEP
jgi:hypothetical protein